MFDAGAETNVPDDVKWAGLGRVAAYGRETVVRMDTLVCSGRCDDADLSTFKSEKFRDEISDYFDKAFLLTYYLWTDYFLAVDQRAKNMMLRTWDGLIWYITYYDGDTRWENATTVSWCMTTPPTATLMMPRPGNMPLKAVTAGFGTSFWPTWTLT